MNGGLDIGGPVEKYGPCWESVFAVSDIIGNTEVLSRIKGCLT